MSPLFWFAPREEPVTGHVAAPHYIDAAGWLDLGTAVKRWPSVRHSRLSSAGGPWGIVWHYTAVKPGVPLWKRIQKYDPKRDRAASWHALIEYDGTIHQSIPFTRGAWHCARGRLGGHRVNASTVGIELAGFGEVFTGKQIAAARWLTCALVAEYPIQQKWAGLLHSELDPSRRSDPGPVWSKEHLPLILEAAYQ